MMSKKFLPVWLCLIFVIQACNYNYYRGTQLEKKKRYEEANISYHAAYISSPQTLEYKEAYERTGKKAVVGMLERYDRYLREGAYKMAFNILEHAQSLSPNNKRVKEEQTKWVKILIAGRVKFEFTGLRKSLQLADKMSFAIRVNTPNIKRREMALIDNQSGLFIFEDVLYNPPISLLSDFSLNSIGIELIKKNSRVRKFTSKEFKNFINLRRPLKTGITGDLKVLGKELKRAEEFYPLKEFQKSSSQKLWYPYRNISYSLELAGDKILVSSTGQDISFLPQTVYINKGERRVFLDFGSYLVKQSKLGVWGFERELNPEREYLKELNKNIILKPYFYYRDGAYPLLKK